MNEKAKDALRVLGDLIAAGDGDDPSLEAVRDALRSAITDAEKLLALLLEYIDPTDRNYAMLLGVLVERLAGETS